MITGRIDRRGVAIIPIRLAGVAREAVLDTGFEGGLELPDVLQEPLDPPEVGEVKYGLGTGLENTVPVYRVTVELDGVEIEANAVFAPTKELLLGVELLAGCRVVLDYAAGAVTLERTRP